MRLLPRQEKFYHLFFEQASIIEQAAQTLLDGVRRGNSHLADVAERIRQLENKGALGTMTGGWRIVHTMGGRLTRLCPRSGFPRRTAGEVSILLATGLKVGAAVADRVGCGSEGEPNWAKEGGDGGVSEEQFEMRHFRVDLVARGGRACPSWDAEVAGDGRNERNGSDRGASVYNRSRQEAKGEILAGILPTPVMVSGLPLSTSRAVY